MNSSRHLVVPFLSIFLFALLPLFANAQTGAGLGLRPAMFEEPITPGETREYTVSVSNLAPTPQHIYVYTRDISSVKEGGVPVFADENTERTGFELSEWVELEQTELDLEVSGSAEINFKLNVPDSASPGSHFGGIFVSVEPPRLRSSGAAIGYEVASILSIRVAGDAVEKAQIRSFSTDNFIYGKPDVTFNARIENQGNVLVRPTGPLEVTNMFGKDVAVITFNESKAGVFPGVVREFDYQWTDEGPGFGRYEARLSLVYGEEGRKQTISSTVSFWILPMNIIMPALLVLAVVLGVTYFGVKMYVRRTLENYGGTRRIVTRRRRGRGMPTGLLVFVVMLSVTAIFLIILLLLFA